MRILATGGSRYAGFHACLELAAHGHHDQPRPGRAAPARRNPKETRHAP